MKTVKELFETVTDLAEKGIDSVFAVIIESSGSAPRKAGSRMLVLPDGTSYGTVGGGSIEYAAVRDALTALEKRTSFQKEYHLDNSQAAELGMVCGGSAVIYFQYISHEDHTFLTLCRQLLENWDKSRNLWYLLDITDPSSWKAGICADSLSASFPTPPSGCNTPQLLRGERTYYLEPLTSSGTVYIFGGGHVAQALVPVLARVEFPCVVFDDRESFASPELFPDAVRCITGNYERIADFVEIHPEDYVCVMTRGHQFDYLIQKQMLHTPARYIGIMGSRKKTLFIREKLLSDGFTEEEINRCKSPIGLDIHAETPEEIAISIAGELIAAKRRG